MKYVNFITDVTYIATVLILFTTILMIIYPN
jgi:hypothetical protein